jgi:hypothetical protein
MKITEEQLSVQLEEFKSFAAKSVNPCTVAKYIAFSDERVRKIFFQKLKTGYVFKGIFCLDKIGIPENKSVYFSFDCQPGTFCLINPSFVVVVNFVDGYVVSILDPYLGFSQETSSSVEVAPST